MKKKNDIKKQTNKQQPNQDKKNEIVIYYNSIKVFITYLVKQGIIVYIKGSQML